MRKVQRMQNVESQGVEKQSVKRQKIEGQLSDGQSGGEEPREQDGRNSAPPGMREAIRAYHMIGHGMKVLVGVSGGADSVCLLAGLVSLREELELSLLAVHVEHGIRGEESLADAAYVAELCERWNVELFVEHMNVEAVARERGLTVEEAGRAVRYEVFARIAQEQGADRIAVAHNRNDQAETVLWNLARGSGVKGLGGIRPVRGRIVRPLLFTDRGEIESYLSSRGIRWRTDRTNLETAYTRNRIRLELLPWLTDRLNAQAVGHIAQAAQRLWEVEDYLEAQTARAAQRSVFAGSWENGIAPAGRAAEGQAVEAEERYAAAAVQSSPAYRADDARKTENQSQDSVFLYLLTYRGEAPLIQKELLKYCLRLAGGGRGLKDVGSVHLESLQALCEQPCGKSCSLPGRITAVREGEYVRFTSNVDMQDRAGGRLALRDQNDSPYASAAQPDECWAAPERPEQPERFQQPQWPQQSQRPQRQENAELPVDMKHAMQLGHFTVYAAILPNSPDIMSEIRQEKKYTKWLSYDTIYGNVCFRKRRTGDYLVVNADGGRKKLKDYLIEQKIPRAMRDSLWLLADGSHILWVVGWRISEAAKVTGNTQKILKIQLEEDIR